MQRATPTSIELTFIDKILLSDVQSNFTIDAEWEALERLNIESSVGSAASMEESALSPSCNILKWAPTSGELKHL